jgi:hypothetical protein
VRDLRVVHGDSRRRQHLDAVVEVVVEAAVLDRQADAAADPHAYQPVADRQVTQGEGRARLSREERPDALLAGEVSVGVVGLHGVDVGLDALGGFDLNVARGERDDDLFGERPRLTIRTRPFPPPRAARAPLMVPKTLSKPSLSSSAPISPSWS